MRADPHNYIGVWRVERLQCDHRADVLRSETTSRDSLTNFLVVITNIMLLTEGIFILAKCDETAMLLSGTSGKYV